MTDDEEHDLDKMQERNPIKYYALNAAVWVMMHLGRALLHLPRSWQRWLLREEAGQMATFLLGFGGGVIVAVGPHFTAALFALAGIFLMVAPTTLAIELTVEDRLEEAEKFFARMKANKE